MNKEIEKKNKIEDLIQRIEYYNNLYYNEDKSEISDYEFDMLLSELEKIEKQYPQLKKENSPTNKIGGNTNKKFTTVKHDFQMMSLSNTYTKEGISEFINRIKKTIKDPIEFTCELKYDGVAIGIKYKNGYFFQAVTRGDGQQGDDVTENIKVIKSVPKKIKIDKQHQNFEVRGEIILPKTEFLRLNEEMQKKKNPIFANPRNTASGTIKLKDSSVVSERNLECIIYGIYLDTKVLTNQLDLIKWAESVGFKTSNEKSNTIKICKDVDEIMNFIDYWREKKQKLDFETDGIVIKVNNIEIQNKLGVTSKFPRWAIAYKYDTEQVESRVLSVDYQVGRTGAIIPVANLIPVPLCGTTVKRASLHNYDFIQKLDLHENDFVFVEKGGEIIPKIVGVNTEKRNIQSKIIPFITHCPECNTKILKNENEVIYFCPNEENCPSQVKGKIIHFASLKAMNIEGFGEETVQLLYSQNLLHNIEDIYNLKFDQIVGLERMAEKTTINLLNAIENSKTKPFSKVLFALGIRYVGEITAKQLVKYFSSIEDLKRASLEELETVPDIGIKISNSIFQYFRNYKNIKRIEQLKELGLNFESKNEIKNMKDLKLKDEIVIISGIFNSFSRDELKLKVENLGGKNVSSISNKTTLLIKGENMGLVKLKKAKELDVKIISEEEFIEMYINKKLI